MEKTSLAQAQEFLGSYEQGAPTKKGTGYRLGSYRYSGEFGAGSYCVGNERAVKVKRVEEIEGEEDEYT